MKGWEPTKIAIAVMLGLSVIGIGLFLWLNTRLEQAEKDQRRALALLSDITVARKDAMVLQEEREADKFLQDKAEQRLNSFFDQIARQEAKMPTGPSTGRPVEHTSSKAKGWTDTSYELTWQKDRNQRGGMFTREQIAAFLWHIENKTKLLKVTELDIDTDANQRNDLWNARVHVTERRPTAAPEPAG